MPIFTLTPHCKNIPMMKKRLPVVAALLLLSMSPCESQASQAYLLDTSGLEDTGDLYLVGALQGIVNRDAPRLFLTRGTPDNVYADYLEKEKGFKFTRLKSLPDAIATFAPMKRADGVTPLIKGLVKYPGSYWDAANRKSVNMYYNCAIAANFAAQEDLLPVTEGMLQGKSSMMGGSEFWYKDVSMGGSWHEMFVRLGHSTNGLSVTSGKAGGYAGKIVYLDLDVTPKIEVVVSDLTPGAKWTLGVSMGSTINSFENSAGVVIPGLTKEDKTGTFVGDLSATGQFKPRAGRALLKIKVSPPDAPSVPAATPVIAGGAPAATSAKQSAAAATPSPKPTPAPTATVTVKSIRLLDANGQEPAVAPYSPPKDVFAGLSVKRDLVASPPYEQNEEKGCDWSLANQRTNSMPDAVASYAPGGWILMGLDYTVAKKVFHFYQNKTPFVKEGYPNLDKILGDFKKPGLVFGWLGDEDYACMKLGHYGARYAGGVPENFSFWQWVPLNNPGKPALPPQKREVPKLENKVYVNFSWASADYIQFAYNLMDGYWMDPNRGQVPVTWGFNPLIAGYAPAFVEFYGNTATPKDSFWGFTAGYTHLSGFPADKLQQYSVETSSGLQALGISPAVDVWDCNSSCNTAYEALSLHSPASEGVKLMSVLPGGKGASETYWLDNGCPVVRLDRGLFSVWGSDKKSTPETIVAAIKAAAAKNPLKGPQFLTCNSRFSPTFLKKVKELLPENIVIVGMPDFIALAQEAGAVTAIPFSDSVGSGDSIKVSFELHNASGTTGGQGKVTWTLPPGWKSSPKVWVHESVPKGGNLKKIVTLTPPAGMTAGTVVIGYKDSRFGWDKEFALTTYPQGATVSDCESTEGWTAKDGAAVSLERGMLKITPKTALSRHDSRSGTKIDNNGRVTCALKQVDLSRKPILKINIPDQDCSGTKFGVTDETGQYKECRPSVEGKTYFIDLSAATKWTGTKDLTLSIDPAVSHGSYARVRSVKVCYP